MNREACNFGYRSCHAANAIATGEKLQQVSRQRKQLDQLLQSLQSLQQAAERKIPSLAALTLQMQELESHVERREKLEALISNTEKHQEQLCLSRRSYLTAKQQFKEQMGDRCPLCNQVLSPKHSHTSE